MSRSIFKVIKGFSKVEGSGVQIFRSLAIREMRNFTPFMLLDHFNASSKSGFGPHPHSGMETVTYLLKGSLAHEDFTGARGILLPGDLQFMTAGKAVVHTEMPIPQADGSNAEGLQLWVDLPEKLKETKPRYRDLRSFEIPEAKSPDGKVEVKVISGKAMGVENVQELSYTPVEYFHYKLHKGGKFSHVDLKPNFNYFLYVISGNGLHINGTKIDEHHNVYFERDGGKIEGENKSANSTPIEFVIVGGQALDQKVLQVGPFVHTNKKRIDQAYQDYGNGVNGFELVKTWKPSIDKGIDEEMLNGTLKDLVEDRERQRREYV
ncbi:hypothetical protein CLIB1423_03S03466 [[Candida] railenensis]|uniref:Pirin n=1 Tax=[Candida] railenensis TaxID=45579 RepID=A0A9P0QMV4_9ASCO|nr:hypothetical protein CLIB1423_03S03466 [[Candida] railenensis]